jgi:hypothetical protein
MYPNGAIRRLQTSSSLNHIRRLRLDLNMQLFVELTHHHGFNRHPMRNPAMKQQMAQVSGFSWAYCLRCCERS